MQPAPNDKSTLSMTSIGQQGRSQGQEDNARRSHPYVPKRRRDTSDANQPVVIAHVDNNGQMVHHEELPATNTTLTIGEGDIRAVERRHADARVKAMSRDEMAQVVGAVNALAHLSTLPRVDSEGGRLPAPWDWALLVERAELADNGRAAEGLCENACHESGLLGLLLSQRSIAAQRRLRPPGHSLGSQRVRVHRDVSRRPRSSGCPLPSRTTGSKRTAERRKLARRQLASTTRAPGWLALGSSLRQQGDRRVQFGRRAVKVWRAQGRGTVPVAH